MSRGSKKRAAKKAKCVHRFEEVRLEGGDFETQTVTRVLRCRRCRTEVFDKVSL